MTTPLRTRRGLRVLLAPLALTAVVATGAPAVAAPPAASVTVAEYGGGYLARQVSAAKGFRDSVSATANALIALEAAGVGRGATDRAATYLTAHLGDELRTAGVDNAGRIALVVLAAVAHGDDPRAFGGTGAQNDLVTRLLATARTTGPDAGLFGAQDPTYDGAYRQGLALAALEAAKVPAGNPKVARGISWLTGQQCANGLWQGYRSDTSAPCRAADPATFTGPDTNSTALAVQGLAAYRRYPQTQATLSGLDAVQSADGGFPFIAAPGQSSDPNSTALGIQALVAVKVSPTAARWTEGGRTPYQALATYQLGCSDPAASRGAFYFPGSRQPNDLATVQAVPAAAGKALPVAPSATRAVAPVVPC